MRKIRTWKNLQPLNALSDDYYGDEDPFETLFQDSLQEGDEDAALIQDFEAAATDLLQSDEELAMAFNAYSEARRRLTEKFRSRGFWPVGAGKSKGRGSFKGSSKGTFGKSHSSSRKSLQQRIMESKCRICGKVGHWKAECPSRTDGSSSASARSSQAPTSFVQPADSASPDVLPLEFLALPETTLDVPQFEFVCANVFVGLGLRDDNGKSRLRETLQKWEDCHRSPTPVPRSEVCEDSPKSRLMRRILNSKCESQDSSKSVGSHEVALFASHSSFGVVDLGATKTVIGSENVVDLLNNLHPSVRDSIERCPCRITFRFGNHGTLQSQQALVIPFADFRLKIAVVPGATPFLLSNTLLRAIGAVIDTDKKQLWSSKLNRSIPLHLTQKGLFLLDLNDLTMPVSVSQQRPCISPTETHVSVEEKSTEPIEDPLIIDQVLTASQKNSVVTGTDESNPTKSDHDRDAVTSVVAPCPQDKTLTTSYMTSATPSGSKTFASSFRYLRDSRHGTRTTVEELAGEGQRDPSRFDSSSTGRSPSREDPIWSEAPWKKLPSCLGQRPDVGDLGDSALRVLNQGGASQVHAIRGASGGEGRKDGREHSGDRRSARSDYQGEWQVLPSSTEDSSREAHLHKRTPRGVGGRGAGFVRDGVSTTGAPTSSQRYNISRPECSIWRMLFNV